MLRVGVINEETWGFFNEIYNDLTTHYRTSVFYRREFKLPIFHTRINRLILHRDLQNFMKKNDVVFFEWASGLLVTATHLKKYCPIITRLHRYEMYQWVDRINWNAVDRVILVSKTMQGEFIEDSLTRLKRRLLPRHRHPWKSSTTYKKLIMEILGSCVI